MGRIVKWSEDDHPDEERWTCLACDAELHVDCVGEKCPQCGALVKDESDD